jgi:nitrous oxidase accessory protein
MKKTNNMLRNKHGLNSRSNSTAFFSRWVLFIVFCIVANLVVHSVQAKQWQVDPAQNLQQILAQTVDGDIVTLADGKYIGNFVINHAITLTSNGNAIIDANGVGNGVLLQHSNITLKNLKIIHWGDDLTAQNAGIYSDKKANNLTIINNFLQGDGFGMWLQKCQYVKVVNNTIIGNNKIRSADRGNGIQLSIVKNAEVKHNNISYTRDGIYIISSQENTIIDNTMQHLRYGIHYMYSHSNKVLNNHANYTRAGYALMSSKHLLVSGNTSDNSEDYGFLLNFINYSTIEKNKINHVWTKPEKKVSGRDGKGLFVYNSGYNTIRYNSVENAEIGIHLTAGSENVKIYGNSFINNPIQVKYVSNKKQEWSLNGKGNFWSNYLGWDMNNDQIGDVIFEPNDGIDKLAWQYPELKMLMDSPAIIVLRWVQKQFPILKPPGIKDSFPLMKKPTTQQQETAHES